MQNRRREDRKFLTYFSRVVDRDTGRLLGYLVDLTTGGALMIGNLPLKINDIFNLRIDLPDAFLPLEQLDIQVKAVWSQPDIDPEFFRTGLQLIDVEPKELLILEKLLSGYSQFQ